MGRDKKKKSGSSIDEEQECGNCSKLIEENAKLMEANKKLMEAVTELTNQTKQLTDRVESLEKQITNPTERPSIFIDLEKRINEIKERLEERTNRQLRKTLVFRGIKEGDDEKRWADTEKVLSGIISKKLSVSEAEASAMIDRCHRGGNPRYYVEKKKTRPIYAAMHSWKQCEEIIWNARKKRDILVDYKFGPLTTARRNMALQRRRELLDSGEILKGHVAYPARLMGMKNNNSKKYICIEDFSKAAVGEKN